MSQTRHPKIAIPRHLGAVAVGSFEMSGGDHIDWHSHPVHQLAWSEQGALAVSIGKGTWVLPPTRALWIPAGADHRVEVSRPATMRSVYFRKRRCPIRWEEPTVIAVTPLVRELIRHLALSKLAPRAHKHAQNTLFDVLEPMVFSSIELTLPTDERAKRVANALAKNPADERTLAAFFWPKRASLSVNGACKCGCARLSPTWRRGNRSPRAPIVSATKARARS